MLNQWGDVVFSVQRVIRCKENPDCYKQHYLELLRGFDIPYVLK